MKTELYIEEHIEPKPQRYIEVDAAKGWAETYLYDPEKEICFKVFKEPEWLHMEEDKIYEFRFEDSDDSDLYYYKVWARLNKNVVLIAEYYNDEFLHTPRGYLGDGWLIDKVETFIADYLGRGYQE